MTTQRPEHGTVLRRIAESNHAVTPGDGLGPGHFVPAFTINNKCVAAELKQRLADESIATTIEPGRLCTRFFVTRENLAQALRVREEFLAHTPDAKSRRMSRDYDSVFLLSPFVLLAVYIASSSQMFPRYAWVAIVVSGATAILFEERINRQYRSYRGQQLSTRDLFIATTVVALNVFVWRAVL